MKIQFKVHRFDFSEKMTEELESFTNLHQYDDRKTFKDAWKEWITEQPVQDRIQEEKDRLQNLGFKGDILDKMFKSVRYYHLKKNTNNNNNQEPNNNNNQETNNNNKNKSRFSKPFLQTIDTFILEEIQKSILNTNKNPTKIVTLQQANVYLQYCKTQQSDIYQELVLLKHAYGSINPEIENKLKKTFKNRFFKIIKDSSLL